MSLEDINVDLFMLLYTNCQTTIDQKTNYHVKVTKDVNIKG